jgi:hypothetical protein
MFFPVVYYAQNIQTGNANAQSTVETNVSGNGDINTHIETTVNGQTNVIDSKNRGIIKVEDNNGNIKIYQNSKIISPTTSIATIASSIKLPKQNNKNVLNNYLLRIFNFFNSIFMHL